jgi:hypothetical protein
MREAQPSVALIAVSIKLGVLVGNWVAVGVRLGVIVRVGSGVRVQARMIASVTKAVRVDEALQAVRKSRKTIGNCFQGTLYSSCSCFVGQASSLELAS